MEIGLLDIVGIAPSETAPPAPSIDAINPNPIALTLGDISKEDLTLQAIETVMEKRHPLLVAYSSGKDSSCLVNLVLEAARRMSKKGISVPIMVAHSDTMVESPEVRQLADNEIRKIREFAKTHGLDVTVKVGRPTLAQTWQVRVIGGRALPVFPNTRRDCTTDTKIAVNERALKVGTQALSGKGWEEPIVCTGVRLDESQERSEAIQARGERSDRPWRNEAGRLMLSPLLQWTTDDVWTYLGYCNAGVYDSYSDFADTISFYRDMGGTSCAVVSDMAMAKFSKPCAARGGCWTCTAVAVDKSMQNMIASDRKRYGYMQPLADVRDFISNTQYDWSRRNFVQRTINDGYITIAADTYSPDMLAELLRYTLTAQIDSGVEVIDERLLVAIDARWSLYGLHPPFEALRIWLDVMKHGNRYYPPKYDKPFPKTPVPRLGRVWVGNDWDDDSSPHYAHGLRNVAWEMQFESCGPNLKFLPNGKEVIDIEDGIEVDYEGACDFMEMMAVEKAAIPITPHTDWLSGYRFYLTLGTVQPGKGQSTMVDELLRRTAWRQRHDLHGQRSREELLARCDERYPQQADMFG